MIRPEPIPADALHARYAAEGAYVDCFAVDIGRRVTLGEFVTAFYTTWLFKLERWILTWWVRKPSNDNQASELAAGQRRDFAAWTEESRAGDQLLMCDFRGDTRSWFRVDAQPAGTRLYFGSVVTARRHTPSGHEIAPGYRWLLGFHRLYSRALLAAAAGSLSRKR